MDKHLLGIVVLNIILTLVIVFFYFFKSKEINPIFGYRTKRSMKDQESWDRAQSYFFKWWLILIPVIYFTQMPMLMAGVPKNMIAFIVIAEFIIGSGFLIYATERQLKAKQG